MRARRTIAVICALGAVAATTLTADAWAKKPDDLYKQLLMPNDFGFDGHSDPGVISPSRHWTIREDVFPEDYKFGEIGDRPAVWGTGSGISSAGVFRPSTGHWYLKDPFGGPNQNIHYGKTGDIPVQAHYQGIDEPTVLAVFRGGYWYLRGIGSYKYGQRGDIPVPGHYRAGPHYADGAAVFRPANGTWYLRGIDSFHYGHRGDVPAPADYNGDGNTDVAVYRPSNGKWYLRGRTEPIQFGQAGDLPVTGDYNGDGKADISVYRPSSGKLYTRGSGSQVIGGGPGYFPIGYAPYHD